MIFFFILLLGLFFGSFFQVLIDRIPREESVVRGRSHCEKCGKTLQVVDLFPVISYGLLRGRCRYCHKNLPISYPLFELLTGVLFLQTAISVLHWNNTFSYLSFSQIPLLLYSLFLVSCLIIIFFIDFFAGIIPFSIALPAILISSLWVYLSMPTLFINHLLAALGAALFFFLCFALTRGRGMGFGDVVFAFLLGIVLGFPRTIIALYIAFLTGAAVSLILILGRKKRFRGSTIAFGPFLILGLYLCYFWGEKLQLIFFHLFHL